MKYFFILLMTINVWGQKLDERVYLSRPTKKFVRYLSQFPSLTIDHPSRWGVELYGPVGTKKWLSEIGIDYVEIQENEHQLSDYPSYEQVTAKLKQLAQSHPHIFRLFSIGKTHEGRELWVMKVSDNVAADEVEPEFKYISSMHGDEITGRELMIRMLEEIAFKYQVDRTITRLVNNTEIFIMPSMNPDGSELQQRGNAHNIDLNRNFPEIFTQNRVFQVTQPETQAVINFQKGRNFSFSANFHGGAVVVNYPWDSTYKRHPFDAMVRDISLNYSKRNPEMYQSTHFEDGITNGADWYIVRGGMQDWSYYFYNDLQVTVELSEAKWPHYDKIPLYYQRNKDSLFYYIGAIHQGAGFKFHTPQISGSVDIIDSDDNHLGRYNFKNSEFYKVLPVGRYLFKVHYQGISRELWMEVEKDHVSENGNYKLIR